MGLISLNLKCEVIYLYISQPHSLPVMATNLCCLESCIFHYFTEYTKWKVFILRKKQQYSFTMIINFLYSKTVSLEFIAMFHMGEILITHYIYQICDHFFMSRTKLLQQDTPKDNFNSFTFQKLTITLGLKTNLFLVVLDTLKIMREKNVKRKFQSVLQTEYGLMHT